MTGRGPGRLVGLAHALAGAVDQQVVGHLGAVVRHGGADFGGQFLGPGAGAVGDGHPGTGLGQGVDRGPGHAARTQHQGMLAGQGSGSGLQHADDGPGIGVGTAHGAAVMPQGIEGADGLGQGFQGGHVEERLLMGQGDADAVDPRTASAPEGRSILDAQGHVDARQTGGGEGGVVDEGRFAVGDGRAHDAVHGPVGPLGVQAVAVPQFPRQGLARGGAAIAL